MLTEKILTEEYVLCKAQFFKMDHYLMNNKDEIFGTNTDFNKIVYTSDTFLDNVYMWNCEYNNIKVTICYNVSSKKITHDFKENLMFKELLKLDEYIYNVSDKQSDNILSQTFKIDIESVRVDFESENDFFDFLTDYASKDNFSIEWIDSELYMLQFSTS